MEQCENELLCYEQELAAAVPRMGPAKRMTLASVALGSLGVIEEADEEMGSDADEGESAPAPLPKPKPAPARAARSVWEAPPI